jgi:hypothetical protein
MAYNLVGPHGNFMLRSSDFPQLLRLAIFYGWKPKGTRSPVGFTSDKWNSKEYLSSEGQLVSDEDALELSNALKKSLRDIPNHECHNENLNLDHYSLNIEALKTRKRSLENLLKYFSGDDKKKIKEFIAYAKCGGFNIC